MKFITFFAAAALLATAVTAQAEEDREGVDDSPSAAAMAVDLLVIRPAGLVATVLGTGLFIAQLPFTLTIWKSPAEPARKLVVEPALYTFHRPLGHME
jgi:hypothetical protein